MLVEIIKEIQDNISLFKTKYILYIGLTHGGDRAFFESQRKFSPLLSFTD